MILKIWYVEINLLINVLYNELYFFFKILTKRDSKSDYIEIMISDKVDEVIEDLFQKLRYFSRYQIGLETLIKGSDVVYECANLLYYVIE